MKYITYKEFNKEAACNKAITIPVNSTCILKGSRIYYENQFICYLTSEDSRKYFAYNEDGNGLTRGQLIETIKTKFNKPQQIMNTEATEEAETSEEAGVETVEETEEQIAEKEAINALWEKFLADNICVKYREGEGYSWIWNMSFYEAPIEDLQHIVDLLAD